MHSEVEDCTERCIHRSSLVGPRTILMTWGRDGEHMLPQLGIHQSGEARWQRLANEVKDWKGYHQGPPKQQNLGWRKSSILDDQQLAKQWPYALLSECRYIRACGTSIPISFLGRAVNMTTTRRSEILSQTRNKKWSPLSNTRCKLPKQCLHTSRSPCTDENCTGPCLCQHTLRATLPDCFVSLFFLPSSQQHLPSFPALLLFLTCLQVWNVSTWQNTDWHFWGGLDQKMWLATHECAALGVQSASLNIRREGEATTQSQERYGAAHQLDNFFQCPLRMHHLCLLWIMFKPRSAGMPHMPLRCFVHQCLKHLSRVSIKQGNRIVWTYLWRSPSTFQNMEIELIIWIIPSNRQQIDLPSCRRLCCTHKLSCWIIAATLTWECLPINQLLICWIYRIVCTLGCVQDLPLLILTRRARIDWSAHCNETTWTPTIPATLSSWQHTGLVPLPLTAGTAQALPETQWCRIQGYLEISWNDMYYKKSDGQSAFLNGNCVVSIPWAWTMKTTPTMCGT